MFVRSLIVLSGNKKRFNLSEVQKVFFYRQHSKNNHSIISAFKQLDWIKEIFYSIHLRYSFLLKHWHISYLSYYKSKKVLIEFQKHFFNSTIFYAKNFIFDLSTKKFILCLKKTFLYLSKLFLALNWSVRKLAWLLLSTLMSKSHPNECNPILCFKQTIFQSSQTVFFKQNNSKTVFFSKNKKIFFSENIFLEFSKAPIDLKRIMYHELRHANLIDIKVIFYSLSAIKGDHTTVAKIYK